MVLVDVGSGRLREFVERGSDAEQVVERVDAEFRSARGEGSGRTRAHG